MASFGHATLLMLVTLCLAAQGCKVRQHQPAIDEQTAGSAVSIAESSQPQAVSLLGKPLYAAALPPEIRKKRELELLSAQADYDRNPHDEDAAIWLGRRLAYLGQYREAIDVYTNALALHPDSTRLLRHRGHRYITLRLFNLALDDLELAEGLMSAEADDWEPDGQPNAQNRPTGTNHSNILYHLGLAHYLTGEFVQAADAWRACAEISRTDDMRVAADYWLYLSLRRSNRNSDAAFVLSTVTTNLEIIENHGYYRLLLLFKGEIDIDEVARVDANTATLGDVTIDTATIGYGAGMWHELRGEHEVAVAQWQKVIEATNWAAFGHIAAEAELARQLAPEP